MAENKTIRVTVWNEYKDAQKAPAVSSVYPDGFHNIIAEFLNKDTEISAGVSIITDPEQGLTEEILDNTDVMIWWGHSHHGEVQDHLAQRVIDRVQRGMGIIFLHSAHMSKPFKLLLGSSGCLSWRDAAEKVRIWTASPSHPIAQEIPVQFLLDHEEMYSEPFGVPEPETTVFISWFEGGNVFRSGLTYKRDYGKIFYFQPGHETHPTFYNPVIQQIITNAVKWAKPVSILNKLDCPCEEALEKIG